MDAGLDVCTGGEGGPRRADSVDGGLGVVPLELYDSARAKIDANLRWLFAKAYGEEHVPADLRDPFYTDQYRVEHIKPAVLGLLLSGQLYWGVCGQLPPRAEPDPQPSSHQAVLQALARRGLHVHEADRTPVSHADLAATPIKMSAHIPLIDALMLAYTVELMSIERVVASVKRFSTFSASKELPFDMEDAMIFWMNKVASKTREISEKELKLKQHLMESPCHQKSPSKWYWKLVPPDLMNALAHCMLEPVEFSRVVRYRRDHLSGRSLPHMPLLEELMKDVCDGAALLTVIHYYCPQLLRQEDICQKEVPSLSDSVCNIQLLKEFCNEYLNHCFYMQTEDLLYAPPVLKPNVMVFIAELFWWFEVVKPDFVQPRDLQEIKDVRAGLPTKSGRPYVAISNATKRSFQATPTSADAMVMGSNADPCFRYYLHPEESESVPKGSPTHMSVHPLLPLRQRQQRPSQGEEFAELRNRSNSLSRMETQGSRFAWADRRQRPMSQQGVDLDWERICGDGVSLARSISKDSLASNVVSITPRHRLNGQPYLQPPGHYGNQEEEEELVAVVGAGGVAGARAESFFLEPLQPAALRPCKEKSDGASKQEESGEDRRGAGGPSQRRGVTHAPAEHSHTHAQRALGRTFAPIGEPEHASAAQSGGFFLHGASDERAWKDSDSEFEEDDGDEDEDEDDRDAENAELVAKALLLRQVERKRAWPGGGAYDDKEAERGEESAKLREEECGREREDKEDASGRSSPCPSTLSQASSASTTTATAGRMTSFAERRMHRVGHADGSSWSTGSSLTTTPDGSESVPFPSSPAGATRPGPASDLVHLRLQLEEKRRAIESQKKKMETLSARQRLRLGKAAFLNVVRKKGRGHDTLPRPLKQEAKPVAEKAATKDDTCAEVLRAKGREVEGVVEKETLIWAQSSLAPPAGPEGDNRMSDLEDGGGCLEDGGGVSEDGGGELDLSECSRSIELLNEAISSIQQQMMQLSLQQDLLIKQSAQSPAESAAHTPTPTNASQAPPEHAEPHGVHFVETISAATRRPPRLSSGRGPRTKPSELKLKDAGRAGSKVSPPAPSADSKSPRAESEEEAAGAKENGRGLSRGTPRNTTFKLCDAANRRGVDSLESLQQTSPPTMEPALEEPGRERSSSGGSGKENMPCETETRSKAQLIEVDLSELADPSDTSTEQDSEQKSGLGFFFTDDQKAEDELAKKRAAFLQKQQRKAEEARVRKQQLEVESEHKRDEARRKAEEERVRKEEEKARRELIKQEYLRRKQRELLEEQGVARPRSRPRPRSRKPRPKSLHRGESSLSTTSEGLGKAPSGSSLSLASTVTEADSVNSAGGSQRGESVESFPMLSRNASRNTERDWDNGSTASSITSVAEYSGPRLFKEPSAKSNKPIIHNAISHCCLAGKVNEAQKNSMLEVLEQCESNHFMILFRDGGCQFRALYSYQPDTEQIQKISGAGPKSIGRKMVDALYKYNSDRKQFTIIPAKTVSVSVDALTIHNHLWQPKRLSSAKRK